MRKTTALAVAAVFLSLGATLPDEGPVPGKKPGTQEEAPGAEPGSKPGSTESPAEQPSEEPPAPAIEAENEASFIACQRELKAHGASFRSLPRIDDGDGCGIDKPIAVDRISEAVRIVPEAILRCETALQLARWTRTVVTSAGMIALPEKGRLTAINHASAYCLPQAQWAENGKISERRARQRHRSGIARIRKGHRSHGYRHPDRFRSRRRLPEEPERHRLPLLHDRSVARKRRGPQGPYASGRDRTERRFSLLPLTLAQKSPSIYP